MLIYVIAGEASGDNIGAKLMNSLGEIQPDITFAGLGGEKMQAEGLVSKFPISEISMMGFAEILPHIPKLLRRIDEVVNDIKSQKPDAVVTIDSPGFNFRVAKKLQGLGVPLIHYVAPTVWAYKPERAAKIAKLYNHLLVILPFEPPYFEVEGLDTTYVGHPVVEDWNNKNVSFNLNERPNICVSFGSRAGEIKRHLPIFKAAIDLLYKNPEAKVLLENAVIKIPTIPAVKNLVQDGLKNWGFNYEIIDNQQARLDAFKTCKLALTKSGTITMELALSKVPMVVAYRVNSLSAWILKKLIKTKFVNLINVISGKEIIPECLQQNCTPQVLANHLSRLLLSDDCGLNQVNEAYAVFESLGLNDKLTPSGRAASKILQIINALINTN